MSGSFAEIVLALSIPVAIGIFFVMRPLPAALVVALGGDLFLPGRPSFHIPYFPTLDKHNLPYVCILIGCLFRCPRLVTKLPKEKWFLILSLLGLVGGVMTGLTNGDLVPCEGNPSAAALPLTFKDGMALGISQFVATCLTFYLGYVLVRDKSDVDRVLVGLAKAGLIYCPLAILEMRISPQLSGWVYGAYGGGGAWEQGYRWGGYRPTVFMPHGLALARFFMATTLALFVLARRPRMLFGVPVQFLAWFHAVVLVLCRSTGAILLCAVGILSITFAKPRRQLLLATILALGTILYPLLRSAQLFPVSEVLNAAGALQDERKESLAFRFVNEDILLAHARERIRFGWGSYGRNLVCDMPTITDGYWIIVLGVLGMVGFLVTFGVLNWPVLWARRRLRSHGDADDLRCLAGFVLILVLQTVDLIPNGLWCYYPFFLAGVLTRALRLVPPRHERAAAESARRSA